MDETIIGEFIDNIREHIVAFMVITFSYFYFMELFLLMG